MRTLSLRRIFMALPLLVTPVFAMAALELTTEAFHEVEVVNKDGRKDVKREPLRNAVPGQEVIYVITYRNSGSKPAEKVVINNPVPPELVFRAGSAEGAGTSSVVSVDGGKSFGVLSALRLAGADGKQRAAEAKDVTHVRWTVLAPVRAGAQGKVMFRAMLK